MDVEPRIVPPQLVEAAALLGAVLGDREIVRYDEQGTEIGRGTVGEFAAVCPYVRDQTAPTFVKLVLLSTADKPGMRPQELRALE